jgi:hypothetical protein
MFKSLVEQTWHARTHARAASPGVNWLAVSMRVKLSHGSYLQTVEARLFPALAHFLLNGSV